MGVRVVSVRCSSTGLGWRHGEAWVLAAVYLFHTDPTMFHVGRGTRVSYGKCRCVVGGRAARCAALRAQA